MMWWNDGFGWGSMAWGGWVVMTLAMVAFWALVIVGVAKLFRHDRARDSASAPLPPRTGEQVLDERLARGEIDVDEYTARRAVLRSAR